jgi:hypothetical protein
MNQLYGWRFGSAGEIAVRWKITMNNRLFSLLRSWLALTLVLALGCGTTADITCKNGMVYHGQIVSSTRSAVRIESDDEELSIPRRRINDIDHPGNVAATLGGILTVYGILNIAVGAPGCEQKPSGYCEGVFLPALLGVALLIYGVSTYSRSVSAARPLLEDGTEDVDLSALPRLMLTGPNLGAGPAFGGRF